MSNDYNERERSNKVRFSREIKLSDLLIVATVVTAFCAVKFQCEDNTRRIITLEQQAAAQEQHLSQHDAAIAVLSDRMPDAGKAR